MEPEVEILSPEQRALVVEQRADEAAAYAMERYGVDLKRVATDPAEKLKLVSAYAADALCDRRSSRVERGAAAKLLLDTVSAKDRESKPRPLDEPEPVQDGQRRFRIA